jgi:hypothetical protein
MNHMTYDPKRARGDNMVAIDLIVQHIRSKLSLGDLRRVYPQLEVIPSNFQVRGGFCPGPCRFFSIVCAPFLFLSIFFLF